jgi:hypothetical protein
MSKRRTTTMLSFAALLAGCGGGDDFANEPRPATPINVTAVINREQITVSPPEFGAGPVSFIFANQTQAAQEVTLETDEIGGDGPGIRQTTRPINPSGTATLKVDMREGTYRVSVDGAGIEPAEITVEGQRPSAQNELLQP